MGFHAKNNAAINAEFVRGRDEAKGRRMFGDFRPDDDGKTPITVRARPVFQDVELVKSAGDRFIVLVSLSQVFEMRGQLVKSEAKSWKVFDVQTGAEWLCGPDEHKARQLADELNMESQLR
jgi:hypothetical protein